MRLGADPDSTIDHIKSPDSPKLLPIHPLLLPLSLLGSAPAFACFICVFVLLPPSK